MRFALDRQHELWIATRTHIALSLGAVAIAALVGIPLGVWTSRHAAGRPVVGAVSALRVIPSLAILALVLPLLGIGFAPALLALIVLACPPIIINTDVAFRSIDPAIREAGLGMGMRSGQLLRRVETPLAFPVVLAGMRTSTVEVIASATLAAFIGGGGLGDFILNGLANNDMRQLLLGGIAVALLALLAESCLSLGVRAARRRVGGLRLA
ncbi:MAG: ABC transporter permease [Candidatus Eremiobacteraeota bacterium]|nr:ABC transporter permease [Candidatus Eremiobacteraeota bacterium]